jgi:hypothetical protein
LMKEYSPKAIPPTNNAAPVHTRAFDVPFDGARAGGDGCCAALAMLCCKSPATAEVARPATISATIPVRRALM